MKDSMRTRGILIFAGVLCWLLGSAYLGYALDDQPASDETVTMGEVVVTGTRTQEQIEKVPANVTVITHKEIEDSNAKDVPDLLQTQVGVTVQNLLGNGKKVNVGLRGFGETDPYNTLVLVDGRRVNEIDLSGVDWTQIPLDQIERIEIVRGMGSVLYGDNAVGGVINIITKTPGKTPHAKVGFTSGSYGRNKESVSLSGGQDKVAASLFATYDSTNGYRENNMFRAKDLGAKIVLDPSDMLRFNISGSHHSDKYGLPGSLSKTEYEQDRRAAQTPLDNAATIDNYVNLRMDLDLADLGRIVAGASYRQRDSETDWVSFLLTTEMKTKTKGFTPRYVREGALAGHQNTFIAGVDLYWTDMDIPTSAERVNKDSQGYYFNNAFSVFENLILSVGARHERVEYEFNTSTADVKEVDQKEAYSAGLTYLYQGKSSLFLRTNKSFRFPLTDELYSAFSGLNADLKPQEGKHYEVGIRHYLSKKMSLNATLYRIAFDNEIFYNPLTYTNENHPKTLHRGIEIGGKAEPCRYFSCYANYTYEKATFEAEPFKGNDIPAVPKNRANFGFNIHHFVPGLTLTAQYNYVGASYAISDQENQHEKLDSYYTIDSRIAYKWKNLEAFFGVNNITDEKYSQYGVIGGFPSGLYLYPAPERNWVAGVSWRF
jgi:iron complex outermembrane receptor protein